MRKNLFSKFISSLFLFSLTLTSFSFAEPSKSASFNIKIIMPGENLYHGTITHKVKPNGNYLRDLRFYDNDFLFGQSQELFDKDSNFIGAKKNDFRCNKEQLIKIDGNTAHIVENNEREDVSIKSGVTFGTGFFDKSRESINASFLGEQHDILMLVPEKSDWYTLKTSKIENINYNGKPAIKLTIVPKSFIIRLVADEVYFVFDTTENHKPLEFSGILPFLSKNCKPVGNGKMIFSDVEIND